MNKLDDWESLPVSEQAERMNANGLIAYQAIIVTDCTTGREIIHEAVTEPKVVHVTEDSFGVLRFIVEDEEDAVTLH
ncbi:MAG: hypothetical protein QQN63_01895 [Nitrosopumilus sp.]